MHQLQHAFRNRHITNVGFTRIHSLFPYHMWHFPFGENQRSVLFIPEGWLSSKPSGFWDWWITYGWCFFLTNFTKTALRWNDDNTTEIDVSWYSESSSVCFIPAPLHKEERRMLGWSLLQFLWALCRQPAPSILQCETTYMILRDIAIPDTGIIQGSLVNTPILRQCSLSFAEPI